MANPQNRPSIPPFIPSENVVVIIDFPTRDNSMHLLDTAIRRTVVVRQGNVVTNTQVLLLRSADTVGYVVGRQTKARNSKLPDVHFPSKLPDVYFPDLGVGQHHFKLVPDWETNLWRVHALSEIMCTVNGVPLQKPTARIRKSVNALLPHVLYLDQSGRNHVTVRDVQMYIWLMKTPREVVTSNNQQADRVDLTLQDVSTRNEAWAQLLYIPTGTQVSNRSRTVLQQFTGRSMVAKMFNDRNRRDVEFNMFSKLQFDASIVTYRESTNVSGTPTIITDLYEGFRTYASLRETLRKMHPGLRFEAATKLIRRLFPALEYLHSRGIVHGNVTHNSVLIRIVNDRIEQVLLVDYSLAYAFSPGDIAPTEAMIADGMAVIQLVDDLCDIWTLRKAPTAAARDEEVMRNRNRYAAEKFETVERCMVDYIDNQGQSLLSGKGKRLFELAALSKALWERAQDELIYNGTLTEVGLISRPALDDMRNEYVKAHGPLALGTGIYWNLSLGHPYLDGLVTRLYHDKWELTPREICEKIREIAGNVEEPWQTFDVTLTFAFEEQARPADAPATDPPARPNLVALAIEPILSWLAVSCEIYPEWSPTLQTEFENTIRSTELGVNRDELNDLHRALSERGTLPSSVQKVFEYLLSLYDEPSQDAYAIDVDYKVWYHPPSSMFNATQLQHLASPEDLRSCIAERKAPCNHFAEVRGSPELEGCYVPMALLPLFIAGLGLTVRNLPDTSITHPTFNPSNFSQVYHQGRFVLARRGLLGYASGVRSLDQFGWPKTPLEIEGPAVFLPTYFGDVKVFPDIPFRGEHPRPDHWAQYVTASSAAADTATQEEIDRASPQSGLSGLLRQRESVRAAAFPKRKADDIDPVEPATRRVRSKTTASPNTTVAAHNTTIAAQNTAAPAQNTAAPAQGGEIQRSEDPASTRRNSKPSSSFVQQRAPSPRHSNVGSTTVVDMAPVGDGDWEKVEQWLAEEARKPKKERATHLLAGLQVNSGTSHHLSDLRGDGDLSGNKIDSSDLAGSENDLNPKSLPARFARLQNKGPESSSGPVDGNETASWQEHVGGVSFYRSADSAIKSALRSMVDRREVDREEYPDTDPGTLGSQELGDLPDADDADDELSAS
jgi:hypothetical protein